MGRLNDLAPLSGGQLVAREHEAHGIVENFGGGAGESVEAVVAQHGEVVADGDSGEFDAVENLHRGKRVDVHLGHGGFHGAQNVAVIKRRQVAGQASLDADLGCSPGCGFAGLLADFFGREEVRGAIARRYAEGTEFTADEADIGEVDVAGDDVADDVSDKLAGGFRWRRPASPKRSSPVAEASSRHSSRVSTVPSRDRRTFSSAVWTAGETCGRTSFQVVFESVC